MLASAAQSLRLKLVVQTPSSSDPATALATETIWGAIDDVQATTALAQCTQVITFENEFVNLEALWPLAQQGVLFRPSLDSIAPLLDKYEQRCYLRQLGLPTPEFAAWEGMGTVLFDFPVVLKTRRHGYDGQGTMMIWDQPTFKKTLAKLQTSDILLEEYVPFERELAVIAARSLSGEIVIYPVVETQQENQVCKRVLIPADLNPQMIAQVQAIAQTLLDNLNAVGVFGIELFLTSSGQVLVNEIAPRTHNSGHYTIDACQTSQFEQHLRAVCGLPLGSPALVSPGAVMVNLLGYEYAESSYLSKRQYLAAIPQSHVHWYGKTQSRPGRKLGHVTVLLDDPTQAESVAEKIEAIWYEVATGTEG